MNNKKRNIILGIALLLIIGSIWYLENTKVKIEYEEETNTQNTQEKTTIEEETNTKETTNNNNNNYLTVAQKADRYDQAPELKGITGYINTKENISIKELTKQGNIVLIDFWTYSCINCIRTLPYLTSWDKKYRDKGLIIIGVHTPEFEFEKEKENVIEAMNKHGVQYAVVQDNNYGTWKAYNNRFWPRKYLIDQDGFIRYNHIGEGAYEETEKRIQQLLEEKGTTTNTELTKQNNTNKNYNITQELYLGYEYAIPREQNIGNEKGIIIRTENNYTLPTTREKNIIYLEGLWKSNTENMEVTGEQANLYLNFEGKEANIVIQSKTQTTITTTIDREEKTINITNPDLYNLYKGTKGTHNMKITLTKGTTINSFTFG